MCTSSTCHPTATPKRQVRIAKAVSLTAKVGAVAFVFGLRDQDAINLQLLGGVWILQIFPAVAVGLFTGRLHPAGAARRVGRGMVAGTFMVVREGFSPVVPLGRAAIPGDLRRARRPAAQPDRRRWPAPRSSNGSASRAAPTSTDLPSRLTVRRRPETGASNP